MTWRIRIGAKELRVIGPYRDSSDRIRAMTAEEQERWCREQGGRLPTAEEFDAIYDTATVRVLPNPRNPPSKASLDALHEDTLAARRVAGERPERVCAGKTWITHPRQVERGAVNYGWYVPTELVRADATALTWRGIPVRRSVTRNAYVIQSPGAAHSAQHVDYSQLGYCVIDTSDPMPKAADSLEPVVVTKPGDRGATVTRWQQWLSAHGYSVARDGIHGPKTELATVTALESHVDLRSQRSDLACAWDERPTDPGRPPSGAGKLGSAPRMPATVVDAFIAAKNYNKGRKAPIRLLVLHSTENPIANGVARNVAQWFAGPSAPRVSAHYVVGPEETIQCVNDEDTAWAAPSANHDGIQIEMVGQALRTDWSREGADSKAGRAVMHRAARLVAHLCREHSLPVTRIDASGLILGERGITTHAAVTQAYKRSSHVDPGGFNDTRWPWAEFLSLIWECYD